MLNYKSYAEKVGVSAYENQHTTEEWRDINKIIMKIDNYFEIGEYVENKNEDGSVKNIDIKLEKEMFDSIMDNYLVFAKEITNKFLCRGLAILFLSKENIVRVMPILSVFNLRKEEFE